MSLQQALGRLSPCDLALVEGYKRATMPKLEVWRAALGKPRLQPGDPNVLGIVSDDLSGGSTPPVFGTAAHDEIATFIVANATVPRLAD